MPWDFNPYAQQQFGTQYQPFQQYVPQHQQYVQQQATALPSLQQQRPQQPQAPMTGNFIVEVYGRAGAEALQLGPNSKIVVYDKEDNVEYRVQTDDAGNKHILEFEFKPREAKPAPKADYVTREDFDALAAKVDSLMPKATPAPKAVFVDE